MQIKEATAELAAPVKAAQQKAKARKKAIQDALITEGAPVRRSSRAAAAVTTAKLSKRPADFDSQSESDNPDPDSAAASSGEEGPSTKHEAAYDPTGLHGLQVQYCHGH